MTHFTENLIAKIKSNKKKIDEFFSAKFSEFPALFYNSVDLRHSGFKIAPVDTNCFPAGFNNLSEASKEKAKIIADNFFNKNFPSAKKIIIIPENHTRNFRYFENLLSLVEIISAKREVVIGTLIKEFTQNTTIDLENGKSITLFPVKKIGKKISTIDGFEADLILLNNDLTNGVDEELQDLEIAVVPDILMGWYNRAKSDHFTIYNNLVDEFSKLIDIDPWLISSMHRACGHIDFKAQSGVKCIAQNTDELIEKLREKYKEYGIDEEPYCYMKADNGTYGMAVMPVFSGADILDINKKERNKMNMLKSSVQTTKVIIQEGIKTIDKIDGIIAEPMIYMIDGRVVGNLFRANSQRDEKISLNASGANFFDIENLSQERVDLGAKSEEIIVVYEVVARLAALASSIELKNQKK